MPAPRPADLLDEQYGSFEQHDHVMRLGMWLFLATEVLLFGALFALYAAYRTMYAADFDEAIRRNTLAYGTLNMYVLLTSSLTVALAVAAIRADRPRLTALLLVVTVALGAAFLVIKGFEYARHIHEGALPGRYYHYAELPTYGGNRFYTLYWVMTGLHALHVTAGLCVLGWFAVRAHRLTYTAARHVTLEMGTLYWHLVDIVWIFLWPILYLA